MASTDKLVYNPETNSWNLPTPPVSPAMALRGQRERIASAARHAPPAAQEHARALVGHLSDIAGTADTYGVIRGTAASGGHGRVNAQAMLDAQRQIVSQSSSAATAELAALKPALLAAVVALPDGVTPEQVADKKSDLCAALEAAGQNGFNQNQRAQQLLRQAMSNGDNVMLWVLLGEPMQYRASALGYSQTTLQNIYAQAQIEKVGLRPLMGAGAVPGAELINLLPEIQGAVSGHIAGATAALNQLAAEVGLQ